jgi:hypothetical protein
LVFIDPNPELLGIENALSGFALAGLPGASGQLPASMVAIVRSLIDPCTQSRVAAHVASGIWHGYCTLYL